MQPCRWSVSGIVIVLVLVVCAGCSGDSTSPTPATAGVELISPPGSGTEIPGRVVTIEARAGDFVAMTVWLINNSRQLS